VRIRKLKENNEERNRRISKEDEVEECFSLWFIQGGY
jgi:hypothetical protein